MKSSDPDNDDYQATSDASTLKAHAEITSDPDRHAKAHAKLVKDQVSQTKAVGASHKMLQHRVKKGLKKAFPSGGKTPFQKAADGE